MSIVAMHTLTLVGLIDEKIAILDSLQGLGCLHLVPLSSGLLSEVNAEISDETIGALKLLQTWHIKQTSPNPSLAMSPLQIQLRAHQIQAEIDLLRDELELLAGRISKVQQWGDFDFSSLEDMGGLALWFYLIPNHQVRLLDELAETWQLVGKDARHSYLVLVSADEPDKVPGVRQHLGGRSLSELHMRDSEIRNKTSELQMQGAQLARELPVFQKHVHALQDLGELARASKMSFDDGKLFGLQAWVPESNVEALEGFAHDHKLVYQFSEPNAQQHPPTLFDNPPAWEVGESLVGFYLTPNYRLWDPSFIVLYSFTVFFAMIMSDAGYGLVMAVLLAIFWGKLAHRNWRFLCVLLTLSTLIWGALVGSYFGIEPAHGSILSLVHVLDMQNMNAMMLVSILVGSAHIILSNLIEAWRLRGLAIALAPLGWVVTIASGLLALLGSSISELEAIGQWGLALGLALVFAFSGAQKNTKLLKRLGSGAMALTRITEAFGNVLSYLRLFALGIASAALAGAFNDLAIQANASVKGLGFVLALLILLIGHLLNFILAFMSGFIHGLRLNLIEFFNWSVREEGYAFRAFKKKSHTN